MALTAGRGRNKCCAGWPPLVPKWALDVCIHHSLCLHDLLSDCSCTTGTTAPLTMHVGVFHCFCNGYLSFSAQGLRMKLYCNGQGGGGSPPPPSWVRIDSIALTYSLQLQFIAHALSHSFFNSFFLSPWMMLYSHSGSSCMHNLFAHM